MYTVLRFFGPDPEMLGQIGTELNIVRPGSFDGLNKGNSNFASTVTDSADWAEHQKVVIAFIGDAVGLLETCRKRGVKVVADIAVGPEDYGRRRVTSFRFDDEALAILHENGVSLEITFYSVPA